MLDIVFSLAEIVCGMYVYVCMYTNDLNVYVVSGICMYVCMCMYVCVCVCMYVYVCVCMYKCMCMYVCVCVCLCMYVCVCMYVCMYMILCHVEYAQYCLDPRRYCLQDAYVCMCM